MTSECREPPLSLYSKFRWESSPGLKRRELSSADPGPQKRGWVLTCAANCRTVAPEVRLWQLHLPASEVSV